MVYLLEAALASTTGHIPGQFGAIVVVLAHFMCWIFFFFYCATLLKTMLNIYF